MSTFSSALCYAQDTLHTYHFDGTNVQAVHDPHYDKVIPDKVFEIGIPLLIIYLITNAIINIMRIRAENRLKEKAFDKGISEETLITLFHKGLQLIFILVLTRL